ncbi:hypothetical protein SDC49_10440 [Lactobacillus sp. R2/2]|nr:hypothetical protein [Lactobacillus sp. R2/2]
MSPYFTPTARSFSRVPLGEILAGLFEGLGIMFLAVYINSPVNQLAYLNFDWPQFSVGAT